MIDPMPLSHATGSPLSGQDSRQKPGVSEKRGFWKSCLFRVAAVGVGLLPLVLYEITLRAFDVGRPSRFEDPFVGFSAVHPLFVLNDAKTRYEIAPSRLSHFRP